MAEFIKIYKKSYKYISSNIARFLIIHNTGKNTKKQKKFDGCAKILTQTLFARYRCSFSYIKIKISRHLRYLPRVYSVRTFCPSLYLRVWLARPIIAK